MNSRPFKDFGTCCARQLSLENPDRINPNRRALICMFDVEMGRKVITVEHYDSDAFERTNGRHVPSSLIILAFDNTGKVSAGDWKKRPV